MESEQVFIFVTVRVPGLHQWPGARPEVSYLGFDHRHIFTVRACFAVDQLDRQLEFMLCQRELRDVLAHNFETLPDGYNFGAASCEMVARLVLSGLRATLGRPARWVEVWEDDENGARVEAAQ